MITRPTFRFAPSPSGPLHLGHAFSALFTWRQAEQVGGRVLLRIEDIDTTRCRPAFAHAILTDLRWLGLAWDGAIRYQSRHLAEYKRALDRLQADGLMYPCFCTRADIRAEIEAAGGAPHLAPGDGGPLYPGTCRRLSEAEREARLRAGEPHALRLDVGRALDRASRSGGRLQWHDAHQGWREAQPQAWGDVVLARKDIGTSYHIAVTVDDALQGVGTITRGLDLFEATDIHCLLQRLLELPVPGYHHHQLITDEEGERLATRNEAASLTSLREAHGWSPGDVRERLGFG